MNANPPNNWVPSRQIDRLPENEIHVWRIPYQELLAKTPQLEELLIEEERAKADRFHFEKDRRSYIISHAATRYILGGYAHITPKAIPLTVNEHGKPQLADGSLQFNLSHSGDFGLLAVTALAPIGIDIERVAPARAKLDLAKRFFSPQEVDHLEQLQGEDFIQGFFSAWTRKEAYIKARGAGLSIPLDSFSVSLKPGEAPRLIEDQLETNAPEEWSLVNVEVDENYAGALAVKSQQFDLKLFDWQGPH